MNELINKSIYKSGRKFFIQLSNIKCRYVVILMRAKKKKDALVSKSILSPSSWRESKDFSSGHLQTALSCLANCSNAHKESEKYPFLDASSHLYKRVCPSVGRSVGPSVGRSVSSNFWSRISLFRGLQRLSTAPAQPHATEIAVYTALFLP